MYADNRTWSASTMQYVQIWNVNVTHITPTALRTYEWLRAQRSASAVHSGSLSSLWLTGSLDLQLILRALGITGTHQCTQNVDVNGPHHGLYQLMASSSLHCHRLVGWGRHNELEASMVGVVYVHVLRTLVRTVS